MADPHTQDLAGLTRRQVLHGGALLGAGVLGAGALAACTSSSKSGGSPAGSGSSAKPRTGGTLTIAASGGGSQDNLDPNLAFDDRAIEYAIAFETSPPSYEPPPLAQAAGQAEPPATDAEPTETAVQGEMLAWSGVMAGPTAPQLAKLNEFAQGRAVVPIDMSAVERVDFVCAGALLNAINRIESQRRAVQLAGVTPIVRALLLLIGISPRHFVKKAA